LIGGFFDWVLGAFDLGGEFYAVRNRPRSVAGAGWKGFTAGYLQGVFHLNERWSISARLEDSFDYKEDDYLGHFPSFVNRRRLLGGRFELDARQSLKLELTAERIQSGESYRSLAFQWSLVLP